MEEDLGECGEGKVKEEDKGEDGEGKLNGIFSEQQPPPPFPSRFPAKWPLTSTRARIESDRAWKAAHRAVEFSSEISSFRQPQVLGMVMIDRTPPHEHCPSTDS
ncbi:hypothetical protein JCGZ_12712 [Jatropha curcas]|uniref:Uncharacterized protein n=1 Tax=Jatropha curcas TaxID=180498 RepID=A0A067KLQ6_JATCU|nr:hypothetical protein JCGZ_12712 [Jatropha curcas]